MELPIARRLFPHTPTSSRGRACSLPIASSPPIPVYNLHYDSSPLSSILDSDQVEGVLLSPVSVFDTSPVKGKTRTEQAASRREKMLKHRAHHQAHELAEAELEQATQYEEVIGYMAEKGIRFGDFLDYIFNPANGQGKIYYHEFLIRHGSLSQMLDWWSSSDYSSNVKGELHKWAMTYLQKTVTREARKISRSRRLQTQGKSIDEKLVMSFSFLELHDKLSNQLAPNSMRLIAALATSRNANTHKSHEVASTGLFASVYDNINLQMKSVEQVIGRHGVYFSVNKECAH